MRALAFPYSRINDFRFRANKRLGDAIHRSIIAAIKEQKPTSHTNKSKGPSIFYPKEARPATFPLARF